MAKIHIENGIISSSADYSLYHGTSPLATIEAGGLRVQGDVIAENMIVSSSTTYMTTSFSAGSTISGDTPDDTHQFTGSIHVSGSASSGLRVDDGHVRAGRDIMVGSIDESFTQRNTNLQLYYGSAGYAGSIFFQKNSTGLQYTISGNETQLNIKSERDNQSIVFQTSTSGNAPTERLKITGTKISGSATSTGSFGSVSTDKITLGHGDGPFLTEGEDNILKIDSGDGTLELGARNSSYAHIQTDRSSGTYFAQPINSGGGIVLHTQGTQATPAIRFSADANTGIYQNTDNEYFEKHLFGIEKGILGYKIFNYFVLLHSKPCSV